MRTFLLLVVIVLAGACAAQGDAPVATVEEIESDELNPAENGDGIIVGDEIEGEARSLWEQREEAIRNFDVGACNAKGGKMRQEGMLGMPRCNISYSDAGKVCSDHSDCQGRCLNDDSVTDYAAAPGQAKGQCEADDSPFGCYAEITGGTLGPTICVD